MKTNKEFLIACSAAIGATGLHPRERLTFLVIAWLYENGNYVARKEICEHTGISSKNISTVLSSLEEKGLVQLNVGAKPSVKILQHFDECLNNEGEHAFIMEASLHNKGDDDKNALIMKANLHNKGDSTESEQGGSSSSPSSSSPDPSINNPSIISPKNPSSSPACVREEDCTFDGFWKKYPRKVGKGKCREKWKELMEKKIDPRDILEGLFRILPTWYKYSKEEQEFIPHPITWLNQMRWEDEVEVDFGDFKPEPEPKPTPQEEPEVQIFSEDEKAFLDVYGKKPHSKEDIDLFHAAFERAMKELEQDIKLLCAAATIAIDVQTQAEGDTRRMKRASYWLDDCEFRQYLKRARSSATYRHAISGKKTKSFWDVELVI